MKKQFAVIALLLVPGIIFASARSIKIKQGTSRIVKLEGVKKVRVSDKNIISATVLTDEEIIVEGRRIGEAVVNAVTEGGKEAIVVKVSMPAESENMIEIGVQMLEIIHSDETNYGIDWPSLVNGSALPQGGLPLSPLNVIEQSPPAYHVFGTVFSRGRINAVVDFLIKKNYAKLLAKPKLLTKNGKTAKFLAGGELPLVTVSNMGQASVEWKKYGVSLEMEPVIVKSDNIEALLKAEVSNLDYANAVSYGGAFMPAIRTRYAETTVTIEPDNTIVIAGLIQNEEANVTEGVPLLSDIPLLGGLFKSTHTENRKTELVIFVTPKILGPGRN